MMPECRRLQSTVDQVAPQKSREIFVCMHFLFAPNITVMNILNTNEMLSGLIITDKVVGTQTVEML